MRLRQLARKLGVHPDKILKVLEDHGHVLENDANSKLTQEQEALVTQNFAPDPVEPDEAEEADESEETVGPQETQGPPGPPGPAGPEAVEKPIAEKEAQADTPPAAPEPEAVVEAENPEDTVPTAAEISEDFEVPFGPPSHATSQVSETESDDAAEAEPNPLPEKIQLEPEVKVYRAYEEDEAYSTAELIETEKPKLEGLKVVGKIELPEPKKPEPKEEEATEDDGSEEKTKTRGDRQRGGRGQRQRGRNRKPRLNPVEYERKKAERLAKKKKKEQEERLKAKKKEHYLKNVKHKAPSKNKATEEEEMAPLPINGMSRPQEPKQPEKPKGKSGLKRIWAWLNGEYDKF